MSYILFSCLSLCVSQEHSALVKPTAEDTQSRANSVTDCLQCSSWRALRVGQVYPGKRKIHRNTGVCAGSNWNISLIYLAESRIHWWFWVFILLCRNTVYNPACWQWNILAFPCTQGTVRGCNSVMSSLCLQIWMWCFFFFNVITRWILTLWNCFWCDISDFSFLSLAILFSVF